MTPNIRLRVSLTDTSSGIGLITDCIHRATGIAAQPEFQELDRRDLLVELSLPAGPQSAVSGLARIVQRNSARFEVLSAWREAGPLPGIPVVSFEPGRRLQICRAVDRDLPRSASRALEDGLPTACWRPGTAERAPHWELAVPRVGSEDRPVALVARRSGYSYRFSSFDAEALKIRMTSIRAA